METNLPDAMNEAESLRALNWPVSRREELRSLLPSVPSGLTRLYQKSRVLELGTLPAEMQHSAPGASGVRIRPQRAGPPLETRIVQNLETR